MNTEEVAQKLVEYCRKGEWMQAVNDLYAKDIVSVEPREMENMPAEMRGLDQVRGKTEWFEKNFEVHSAKVGGPFVAGETFVVQFDLDATEKASGKRMPMSEVGVYKVKDGKVAREEFLPLAQKKQ
ncbi:MAG: nuclear transport factor 2 family protein [Verrucomicrobia bacterium]|nr:MAG: nuclear transport factor 2 family protein [Verrucomicrobiota bacterium]PYK51175.1 MAG: nuclear transport factor 2 family protein [Verrucomicrobiota bacterium]